MWIGETASGAEYRMDKQFQNLQIFGILIVFQSTKFLKIWQFSKLWNSGNLFSFEFEKCHKFPIWKIREIPRISN